MPARAVRRLENRDDVASVSPDRPLQRAASVRELTTGTITSDVRSSSSFGSYSGLDGSGVGIAVLDSGIMKTHGAFANAAGSRRVVRSVNLVGMGATAVAANGYAPGSTQRMAFESSIEWGNKANADPYGHGTHVAAVAAGRVGNPALDAGGVAPGAPLIDVRVLGSDGTGTMADALAGIGWVIYDARQHNIRVMDLSLAGSSSESWQTDPLARAARSATAAGIAVVVSAGDFGGQGLNKVWGSIGSPGIEPSVITVGSTHMQGTTARGDDTVNLFSSRGPTRGGLTLSNGTRLPDNLLKPDLVAPGNRVVAASASSDRGLMNFLAATYPALSLGLGSAQTSNQQPMMLSGASASAPVVSGALALMLQANPGLTPPLVKAILQYSAQPLPGASLAEQGAGLLIVDGALRLARALRTDIASRVAAGHSVPAPR